MLPTGRLFPHGLGLALALAATLCAFTPAVSFAQVQGQAVITNSYANLRSGPGTKFKRLGRALAGDRFPVTATRPGWFRIVYKGREAWLFAKLARLEQAGPSTAEVGHLETQIENLNQRVDQVSQKLDNVRQTLEAGIAEVRPEESAATSMQQKKNGGQKFRVQREVPAVGAAWAFIPGASRMKVGQRWRGGLMLGLTAGCAASGLWARNSYNSLRDDYRALPAGSPQSEFDRLLSRSDDRRNLSVWLLAGTAGLYAFNVTDHFLFLPRPNLALSPGDTNGRIDLSLTCEF
ncbi:SH3 domain-containing protein [bacterium]|nr:SH3 domain-containing protein [bacterium]